MPGIRRLAIVQPERGATARRQVWYLLEAARRAGIVGRAFASSDLLEEFDPDAVIAASPEVAKLTRHPTYGWLTASWIDYQRPRLLRNVLSCDAYLTASSAVRQWIEDVSFGARKVSPVGFFAPGVPATAWAAPRARQRMAFLDGDDRASAVAALLERAGVLDRLDVNRVQPGGELVARVREALTTAGVGLWIDPAGAATDGQPALPLFEIVAAGAVAITSRQAFVEQWFGDAVLYVDAAAPPEVVAWQVGRHLTWIAEHPDEAAQRAAAAHDVFVSRLALDVGLRSLAELHERVLVEKHGAGRAAVAGPAAPPSIVYVVRTDGSPERVLHSLRAQQDPGLRVVLVPSSPSRDLSGVAAGFADLVTALLEPGPEPVSESSLLWAGLNAARASGAGFFGILDDRDELFPNHVQTLRRTLDNLEGRSWFGSFGLAYSGAAERARTVFEGDRLSRGDDQRRPVRCRVRHFRFYHPGYLEDGAHEVHPGAFLARTALLDDEVLTDPGLDDGAASYLELLLAEKTLFGFSCELTMVTHERDDDSANPDRQPSVGETARRTFFRTYGRQFPAASVYLHNVIFMTAFDKDLLSPMLMPGTVAAKTPGTVLAMEPVGDAARRGQVVRVSGRPGSGAATSATRLSSGRYRLRAYFESRAAVESPPFGVCVSRDGTWPMHTEAVLVAQQRIEHGYMAEYELDLAHEQAVLPASIRVESRAGTTFDVIAVHLDRLAQVLSRSVLDLPVDRPLWLYGAGEGGRQAKRKLELSGLRVEGFIDKFKTGSLEGVPIVDLPTAREQLRPDATVIIASMFWEEIRQDIESAGVAATLYSFYPFTGDVVYALN